MEWVSAADRDTLTIQESKIREKHTSLHLRRRKKRFYIELYFHYNCKLARM